MEKVDASGMGAFGAQYALAQEYGATCRISVDPHQRFQTIDGFGVNVIGPWFRDDQKPMFDMLIDDLGATMFRVGPLFCLQQLGGNQ